MTLRLYNTLTRRKEAFEPLDPANVRMYVCGPTVYDYAHIGNARPVIVFDVLFRLLRHLYGPQHVTYARNITDVDDKIIARAAEEGVAIDELTARTTRQFHEDVAALGCLPPTLEPRATEHIPEMISMIGRLIETGHAYEAEGHVLFHVPSMPDYGKLARRSLDDMQAGARVEVAPFKRDPMDFVLWKPAGRQEARSAEGATGRNQEARSAEGATGRNQEARSAGGATGRNQEAQSARGATGKNQEARSEGATGTESSSEPGWDSPWGHGRPGWHIECSAMAAAHLGVTFDIHGGGIDLVFPHHENEIAQSRCAHSTEIMARYWLHNGFLQVEGEKMSKSLGNFVTIDDLLRTEKFGGRRWPGEVLRFNMLRTRYSQPLDWTSHGLKESYDILQDWYRELDDVELAIDLPETVIAALCDDLNSHAAITELHKLAKQGRKEELAKGLRFLGFSGQKVNLQLDVDLTLGRGKATAKGRQIDVDELVNARTLARKAKNFAEADRIRHELAEMGIQLNDTKDPETGEPITTWEVAR